MKSVDPAANSIGQGSRVDGIDLLRGLAIFYVLMNHVNMRLLIAHVPYTAGLPKQFVNSLVWNGQNGVQMFLPFLAFSSPPFLFVDGGRLAESILKLFTAFVFHASLHCCCYCLSF